MAILTCEALFGRERGAEIQELVERLVDGPCPCKSGRVCPLLASPEDGTVDSAAS
jgi:hypothetical protein